MSVINGQMEHALQIYARVMAEARHPEQEIRDMKMTLLLSGLFVESVLEEHCSISALEGFLDRLVEAFDESRGDDLSREVDIPPALIVEKVAGTGRRMAHEFLTSRSEIKAAWLTNTVFSLAQETVEQSQSQGGNFNVNIDPDCMIECIHSCMAFEMASQEISELVLERFVEKFGWSLAEAISGLASLSGSLMAQCMGETMPESVSGRDAAEVYQEFFDELMHSMTREAVRYGAPTGSDWMHNVPANDGEDEPPYTLVTALEPACSHILKGLGLEELDYQAVACARAAGRLLALAVVGEEPYLPAGVAKPLAVCAMSETYRHKLKTDLQAAL